MFSDAKFGKKTMPFLWFVIYPHCRQIVRHNGSSVRQISVKIVSWMMLQNVSQSCCWGLCFIL